MNRSTRSHQDMFQPVTNSKASLHARQDPLFETARDDAHGDVLISAWGALLDYESKLWFSKAVAGTNNQEQVEHETGRIEIHRTNEGDMIEREVKSCVKKLDTTKLLTMGEKELNDILRASSHNSQSCIRSVVLNSLQQAMLNLLRKDVIEETLSSHIAECFDTNTA